MPFPTLPFALFFLLVFWLTWELRARAEARKTVLVVASYVFYGCFDWRFMALLAASSLLNYAAARLVSIASRAETRRVVLAGAIALNLAILGAFKYLGFFLDQLGHLLAALGLERDLPMLAILFPIGLSFFTLQGISYLVDVYRGEVEAEEEPLNVLLYLSFFPLIVAGPLVRAATFLPQLRATPVFDRGLAATGIVLILVGLIKKVLIADTLAGALVDPVFADPRAFAAPDLALAIYGFAVQIYCDFSGYCDMAIGLAALLGFRVAPNFAKPYAAASLRAFWRRWAISLSDWVRDYLYRPLGGSHPGMVATSRNLMLVMLIVGLWQGAAWTFILFGAIHGAGLVAERMLLAFRPAPSPVLAAAGQGGGITVGFGGGSSGSRPLGHIAGVLITFNVVCFAWVFFRSNSVDQALAMLRGLDDWSSGAALATPFLALLIGCALAMQFTPTGVARRVATWMERQGVLTLGAILGAGLLAIQLLAPESAPPFIYSKF